MFVEAGQALVEALDGRAFTRDELLQLLALRDRLEARFARAVADFDRSAEWAFDGAVSPVHWLGSFARLAVDDARRLLALGTACRQLPVTAAAVADGTLSAGQTRQIAAHVSDKTVAVFVEHEPELVPTLAALPVRQVGWVMARWQRHAITELGLEKCDGLPERSLRLSQVGGRWRLDGDLDVEGGALLDTAIRHAITRDADGEPPRTLARRRADALVDIMRWYLDHHHDTNTIARRRTHLDIIITVDALRDGAGGELVDGTPIDAKTVARLACDADVHRVIMDGSSTVLDYGRRARIVPNGLRGALNVRDRGCRFPDCDRPPSYCEAHHIVDWQHGGHTRPDNLILLCSRHHHIVHLDGWHHTLEPDNTLTIKTPTGRVLRSRTTHHAQAGPRPP